MPFKKETVPGEKDQVHELGSYKDRSKKLIVSAVPLHEIEVSEAIKSTNGKVFEEKTLILSMYRLLPYPDMAIIYTLIILMFFLQILYHWLILWPQILQFHVTVLLTQLAFWTCLYMTQVHGLGPFLPERFLF